MSDRELGLVTGCPRSGTTALVWWLDGLEGVEAISESRILLAAHRWLEAVGRFRDLEEHRAPLVEAARRAVLEHYERLRPGTGLLIDKEPLEPIALPEGDYDRCIRNAREVFPRLKILFATRHPVPSVWSMLQRTWGHSLTSPLERRLSVEEAVEIWRANARLAAGRRDDPLSALYRFEDLVEDPDGTSLDIRRFFGIGAGRSFEPRRTKKPRFAPEQRAFVLEATAEERRELGYSANSW